MLNQNSIWRYLLVVVVMAVSFIYALPNIYPSDPSLQINATRGAEVSAEVVDKISTELTAKQINSKSVVLEDGQVLARFLTTEDQLKAREVIEQLLGDKYVTALNLAPATPAWMDSIGAAPMKLGLDLRGGVHFLMEIDMKTAMDKNVNDLVQNYRTDLREAKVRYRSVAADLPKQQVVLTFRSPEDVKAAQKVLSEKDRDMVYTEGADNTLLVSFSEAKVKALREDAVAQNITIIRNRVNAIGVAEPLVQRQGAERIVVQLPGVQDTEKAKDFLGRTETLEVRLVDEGSEARAAETGTGPVPFGSERYLDREGIPVIVKKQVILTGENLTDAQPGFDGQTQEPTVNLSLDAKGARIFRDVTRENINKRMAILLFEKGKGEVVTAPVIRAEIGGGRVQISGRMTTVEAADTALLLRAGSLAAPMEIIEERTIGPSLGAENIAKGFLSVTWGFVAVAIFMCAYYMLFGVISSLALAFNLLLLVAVLSMLQATLTLPGMAAMALVLGMAIDANVLINERVREELRNGASPQAAIHAGYDRAWATIIDSNVTTLIAGLALLAFGSGPVRGFAVVHCLGILTSMFSGVFFSRGLVNLWYGRQKKLKTVSIGTVWRPDSGTEVTTP